MNTKQYDVESAVEARHWWYVNRRRLLADTLARQHMSADALVLDAGCGTGPNLRLLHEGGIRAAALDRSADAVAYCRSKGFARLVQGSLEAMPYPANTFDVVLSTDTMGYLRGTAGLDEMRRVVKPGGIVIITAPALQCLWGHNDDDIGHIHRYNRAELRGMLVRVGLDIEELYYFNYLLFLPIFCARHLMRLTGWRGRSESHMTPGWMNAVLSALFYVDVRTARRVRPLAGVSLMAVARKPRHTPI